MRAAQAGADVVLAARTESRLAEVAKEVDRARAAARWSVPTDITDDAAAQRLADAALASSAGWTRWCNNAFAMPPMRDLAKVDLDDLCARASRPTCSPRCG